MQWYDWVSEVPVSYGKAGAGGFATARLASVR